MYAVTKYCQNGHFSVMSIRKIINSLGHYRSNNVMGHGGHLI
jgi:hypothetical protein